MILHVYDAAKDANIGEVIVASPDEQILELVKSYKAVSVKTSFDHKTGTDRIFEVFDKFLKQKPKFIINLQGDMPNIDPNAIKSLSEYISKNVCDIATLSSKFIHEDELNDVNKVKVLTKNPLKDKSFENVIDFNRSGEIKKNEYAYHHIGIYAFTKEALIRYVGLKRTKKEIERNLEQLRALENNMKINVGYTSSTPLSIDTEEDLINIKNLMK